MKQKSKEVRRFLKFLMVGVMNTAVTFFCYSILRFFQIAPITCNAVGYICGVVNSFIWNKKWVFRTKKTNIYREAISFLIVFLLCYFIQFWTFSIMLDRFHINDYIAQLLGMIVYTILNYTLNKLFSFNQKS